MTTSSDMENSFEVDEKVCPLEAVQNAAYTFTDRFYARVEPSGEGKLRVVLTFKAKPSPEMHGVLKGEFDNELLHQALRLRVSDANRKIREFIVTKALVSAQPASVVAQAAPADCPECVAQSAPQNGSAAAAPVDEALEKEIDRLLIEIEKGGDDADPLGVSVPWEEKFAAKEQADGKAQVPDKAKPKSKRKDAPAAQKGVPQNGAADAALDEEVERLLSEIEKADPVKIKRKSKPGRKPS